MWKSNPRTSLEKSGSWKHFRTMDNTINFNLREKEDLGERLIQHLKFSLDSDSYWSRYLESVHSSELKSLTSSIHLAIFGEPFLQFLLDGKKTIESRFSINKCAPFNKVAKGDLLLIKKSGGPIVAICTVKERWYYKLNKHSWDEIRQYQDALCANDPSFWEERQDASFATLIMIGNMKKINPIEFEKRDRRGWVVISDRTNQYSLL
jgi:hypothetical protein